MKLKIAALLISGLVATSASASDALDQHLIELGFLAPEVQQSVVVRGTAAEPRDAVEAVAVESGFLTLPAAEVTHTVQLPRQQAQLDLLTQNLVDNGFMTAPLSTVSVVAGSAPAQNPNT
ncbi:hypothetical protein CAI21_16430 [Alkalilimnicola ehrlichii]|uniref:hypothetical protein n=1 Tax=Alkalilimnicola ehrlichii TaxID=351052 RepID=UPI000E2FACE1|nr:hypothetical protein [Alkalilimnicola ehrlichii]RFA26557.1 hypothetical protein CAI21_16430 [Alkalilimnicola ehrlichii]